jgi:hypothetical protein
VVRGEQLALSAVPAGKWLRQPRRQSLVAHKWSRPGRTSSGTPGRWRAEALVRLLECDVAFDPSSSDVALVPLQCNAEPSTGAPLPGPHVQIIRHPHDPDDRVPSQRPVHEVWSDLQLVSPSELLERPPAHRCPSVIMTASKSSRLPIGLCNYSRRRSIEHDADLARGSLIGDAVGLSGLLELIAMRDNAFRMKVPANQVLEQVLHVTQ